MDKGWPRLEAERTAKQVAGLYEAEGAARNPWTVFLVGGVYRVAREAGQVSVFDHATKARAEDVRRLLNDVEHSIIYKGYEIRAAPHLLDAPRRWSVDVDIIRDAGRTVREQHYSAASRPAGARWRPRLPRQPVRQLGARADIYAARTWCGTIDGAEGDPVPHATLELAACSGTTHARAVDGRRSRQPRPDPAQRARQGRFHATDRTSARLAGPCGRSRQAARMRWHRRSVEHAVANRRGGEGQGQSRAAGVLEPPLTEKAMRRALLVLAAAAGAAIGCRFREA